MNGNFDSCMKHGWYPRGRHCPECVAEQFMRAETMSPAHQIEELKALLKQLDNRGEQKDS